MSSSLVIKFLMMKTKLCIRLVKENVITVCWEKSKKWWRMIFFNSMTNIFMTKTKRHNQIFTQHWKLLKSSMLTKRHKKIKTHHAIKCLSSNSSSQWNFSSHRCSSTFSWSKDSKISWEMLFCACSMLKKFVPASPTNQLTN